MQSTAKIETTDLEIRRFIYATFAEASRPPATAEAAAHFGISIAAVEAAYERLAGAHHIALAPGSQVIWMAHPFSALPTNFVTEANGRRYWGNCAWDMLGIAAILGRDASGRAPCGCGECREKLDLDLRLGRLVDADWLVHFVVPAAKFWENIGFT
jgi:hypothetical protein